jgi:uncharacterized protein (DUF302 family)
VGSGPAAARFFCRRRAGTEQTQMRRQGLELPLRICILSGSLDMADENSPDAGAPAIVTIKSAHSFTRTVERLAAALESHGIKIFLELDQQAEAASAGLAMPPTVLIVFGNPKAGTPLMLAQPLSGLDLPLKVLVSEAVPGAVLASFNSAQYLIRRHALPETLAANIAPAERLIAAAIGA